MSIKKDIVVRIYVAFFAMALFGGAVLFRAGQVQTVHGTFYRDMADSLTLSYRPMDAERGNVLSSDGRLLATSLPFFEVRADMVAVSEKLFEEYSDSLALCMSTFFGDKSKNEYHKKLVSARRGGKRYLLIRKGLTYPELQTIKSWPIFRKGRYRGGIIVLQKNKRVMPFKLLAHRTIGYVRDDIQPVGLEGTYDDELTGVKGKRLMQRIAGGTWVPVNDEEEISSVHGKDIITTIDINLQDVTENALLKALKKHKADHGTAIVMEVATGQIKAIANLGKTKNDEYWESYNYAVGEATEPGSTLKTASMIALFEDNLVSVNDSVDLENGRTKYYDKTMRDSDKHDYRNVTAQMAFEISSNVGISRLINDNYLNKPQQYIDHLKAMGLDQKTGIEIKGEPSPLIKDADDNTWSGVSLPWMSVGYELTITPLQQLAFYNAIANNGKMMKPYLVKAIREYGEVTETIEPEVLKESICSQSTLDKIRPLLEGVVERGTAKNLKSANYKIAGKTGTAQIAMAGRYQKVYQASFAGYFPADDPQYSCIVIVNSPKSGIYYGGWVAGPVFREIADKVYASAIPLHDNISHDALATTMPSSKSGYQSDVKAIYASLGMEMQSVPDMDWVKCSTGESQPKLSGREMAKGVIPDVRGMGLRDAIYLLENEGLKVVVKGRGKVVMQSVIPGTRSTDGREIVLTLS